MDLDTAAELSKSSYPTSGTTMGYIVRRVEIKIKRPSKRPLCAGLMQVRIIGRPVFCSLHAWREAELGQTDLDASTDVGGLRAKHNANDCIN